MQNHLENRVYAGFFVRFVAFAIDSMIAALVVGMVKLPFSIAAMGGVKFLTANFIFDYSFLDVLSYVGVAAYFVLLTYFTHSTPGKMLFRLEVVTSKEEWTFLNVLYRETIGRFLSSLLCIGYFAVLVQTDKQGFHDMLCDTYVVYKNMTSMPSNRPMRPAMAVPAGNVNMAMQQPPVKQPEMRQPVPEVRPNVEPSAPVYHTVSAFQVTESHPIQAETNVGNASENVMGTELDNQVEETKVVSTSYDNINPDSTNLDIDKK